MLGAPEVLEMGKGYLYLLKAKKVLDIGELTFFELSCLFCNFSDSKMNQLQAPSREPRPSLGPWLFRLMESSTPWT